MKVAWKPLAGAGLAALAVGAVFWIRPVVRTGTGLTAHNICAATFTSGLSSEATFNELVKPMVGRVARLLRYRVDWRGKAVRASLAGGVGSVEAVYTQGYGCRLIIDRRLKSPSPVAPRPPSPPDGFAPGAVVAPSNPILKAALDQEFAETPGKPPRYVKAVVIVKNGHVVAERYAPGFGVNTPVLSYSVSKSITNALLAVLVRQGRLNVNQPVNAPEWRAPGDPRRKITLNDLLRMQSGLDAAETGSGFDPASQMLYTRDDMAAFAARHPLGAAPGTVWRYTSANTLILDRVIGETIGGGPAGLRQFADKELFAPLHMDGVTLEFDGAGDFSGSGHVYAPARAFARFGWLYLNDGVAPDGRRLLPEGWASYSRRSTLGSSYGAGFWTNDGPSEDAAWRVAHGFPKDGFYASGHLGQRIFIVPSERLVMVRFGYTGGDDYDIVSDLRLMKTAISVLKSQ